MGLTGCRVTDAAGGLWGAAWLTGHGAGLAGVQVPCASGTVGCHVAPLLKGIAVALSFMPVPAVAGVPWAALRTAMGQSAPQVPVP